MFIYCGGVHVCHKVCEEVREQLSGISLYSRNQALVVGIGQQTLHLLGHLAAWSRFSGLLLEWG